MSGGLSWRPRRGRDVLIYEICLTAHSGFTHAEEGRRAQRERTLLQARVSFAGGSMSFPCIVTQISATGAKISVKDETVMPEHFQISIPQRRIDCEARLVWRRAGHAGVAFKLSVGVAAADAPLDVLQARLQALEAENKAQRATIEKLTAQLSKFREGY